jgi:hypothetical protein
VEIERGKFFKMYNFLYLGLDGNIIGLYKCVLILWNIETTKGSDMLMKVNSKIFDPLNVP